MTKSIYLAAVAGAMLTVGASAVLAQTSPKDYLSSSQVSDFCAKAGTGTTTPVSVTLGNGSTLTGNIECTSGGVKATITNPDGTSSTATFAGDDGENHDANEYAGTNGQGSTGYADREDDHKSGSYVDDQSDDDQSSVSGSSSTDKSSYEEHDNEDDDHGSNMSGGGSGGGTGSGMGGREDD